MAGLTFQNSIRLHFDSIVLYKNKSYPSAYFLSILALEELGKVYLLDHFLFHSRTDGRMGAEMDKKWLNDIYNHKSKQSWFEFATNHLLAKEFIRLVRSGKLEILKQNSVYVGLPKIQRSINLKGKIINPFKITDEKSKNQITIMNDCLLEQCLIVIKEIGCLDTYYAEEIINEVLVNEIEKRWEFQSCKAKQNITQLKKIC